MHFWFIRNSYSFRFLAEQYRNLAKRLPKAREAEPTPTDRQLVAEELAKWRRLNESAFDEVLATIKAKGLLGLVVIFPAPELLPDESGKMPSRDPRVQFVLDTCAKHGVASLDLHPLMTRAHFPPNLDGHPTAEGHTLAAEAIYRTLLASLTVPGPGVSPAADGAKRPSRIVSLSPSVTETLFALGMGDRVVGVTDYCTFPPEAKTRKRVGGFFNPDVEAILSLAPELVVTVPNAKLVQRLEALKMRVVVVPNESLEDVFTALTKIGEVTGTAEVAVRLVSDIRARLEQLRKRAANLPKPKVLFAVNNDPLMVAGGGTFINDLIALAGGVNIAALSPIPYPQFGMEEIVARAPDLIVDATMIAGDEAARLAAVTERWQRWPSIPAVKNGRICPLGAEALDVMVRPGPRIAKALEHLLELIHPEAQGP
jgi:iron complex transport system substrate-binding protein